MSEFEKRGKKVLAITIHACFESTNFTEKKLHIVSKYLIHPPFLDQKPETLGIYDAWEYGSGNQASASNGNIDSVEFFFCTDRYSEVLIRRLLLSGRPVCAIECNIKVSRDMGHAKGSKPLLPDRTGGQNSSFDDSYHSCLQYKCFKRLLVHQQVSNF